MPSRFQKGHDLIETFAVFAIRIHDSIIFDPAFQLMTLFEFCPLVYHT